MPEYHPTFRFVVELGGVQVASFKEATGLETSTGVIEFKETTSEGRLVIRKVPGAPSYGDLTLRRHVDSSTTLFDWHRQVEQGDIDEARQDGSIVLLDSKGSEVQRWNFAAGWPSKWAGPSFDAGQEEVAVEEVTIAHEGVRKA